MVPRSSRKRSASAVSRTALSSIVHAASRGVPGAPAIDEEVRGHAADADRHRADEELGARPLFRAGVVAVVADEEDARPAQPGQDPGQHRQRPRVAARVVAHRRDHGGCQTGDDDESEVGVDREQEAALRATRAEERECEVDQERRGERGGGRLQPLPWMRRGAAVGGLQPVVGEEIHAEQRQRERERVARAAEGGQRGQPEETRAGGDREELLGGHHGRLWTYGRKEKTRSRASPSRGSALPPLRRARTIADDERRGARERVGRRRRPRGGHGPVRLAGAGGPRGGARRCRPRMRWRASRRGRSTW